MANLMTSFTTLLRACQGEFNLLLGLHDIDNLTQLKFHFIVADFSIKITEVVKFGFCH